MFSAKNVGVKTNGRLAQKQRMEESARVRKNSLRPDLFTMWGRVNRGGLDN